MSSLYSFLAKEKENNRKKINLVGKCKEVNQRKRYTILLNV